MNGKSKSKNRDRKNSKDRPKAEIRSDLLLLVQNQRTTSASKPILSKALNAKDAQNKQN